MKYRSVLTDNGSTELTTGATLAELIRRPELSYDVLAQLISTDQSCLMMYVSRLILI